ncbi:MAG: VanW family protein [Fimbriimonas sp.]
MKKVLIGLAAALGGAAGVLSITAARYQETIRPNTKVGTVDLSGLTHEEAAKKLRVWWEGEKLRPLELKTSQLKAKLEPMRPGLLGVTLDDQESVKGLPLQTFLDDSQARVTGEEQPTTTFELKYKPSGLRPLKLAAAIKEAAGEPRPARIRFEKGTIHRTPEQASVELDESGVLDATIAALQTGGPVEVPLRTAPKHIPDEELAKIREVVSEFSTRFSAGNVNRSENIRLAAKKIDGVILMPGERFSFNGTVGRRTRKAGFREAGVYINGRHDTGIGGGICQVSTTLYNAALFANLAIKRRSNHSMPVPYVPVGRDATVDYGNLDLELENNYEWPIALDSEYHPGRLLFRVLGTKKPGLSVKVVQGPRKSFAGREKRILDPTLPVGRTRVIESGSAGHSLYTYRHIYQDGQLVAKEPLGRSHYGGGIRIVAVGTRKPTPKPVVSNPPTTAPGDVAPAPIPSGSPEPEL